MASTDLFLGVLTFGVLLALGMLSSVRAELSRVRQEAERQRLDLDSRFNLIEVRVDRLFSHLSLALPEVETYDTVLEYVPSDKKIAAIKALRKFAGTGLAETKRELENLPVTLVQRTSRREAERVAQQFSELGFSVSVKSSRGDH